MNRILKFRIWDKSENRWVAPGWNKDPHGLEYHQSEYYLDTNGIARELGSYGEEMDEVPNVTIQQYTGLNDSDGKEIYEGDILGYITGQKGYVYSCIGIFYLGFSRETFTPANTPYASLILGYLAPYTIKIIGNVFESPELLK